MSDSNPFGDAKTERILSRLQANLAMATLQIGHSR
jgi:hypothetical protein